MKILALISICFALIQLVVVTSNYLFSISYKKRHKRSTREASVSVLIPARNEEKNLSKILSDINCELTDLDEVIVFDDESEDNTLRVAEGFKESISSLKTLHSDGLKEGWLGKNYGCYNLSKEAKGDYLLFVDADVRLHAEALDFAVSYMEEHHLGMMSIFPKQVMISNGEKIVVPIMNQILLNLLPLFLVKHSTLPSLSAANGQFLLFKREVYNELEPHSKFRDSAVEDIMISRFLKRMGIRISTIVGVDSVCCRMYSSFNEAVKGFSKNILHFFGGSFFVAILFWLLTYGTLILFSVVGEFKLFLLQLTIMLLSRWLTTRISKESLLWAIINFIPHGFIVLFVIIYAQFNRVKRGNTWKGRSI